MKIGKIDIPDGFLFDVIKVLLFVYIVKRLFTKIGVFTGLLDNPDKTRDTRQDQYQNDLPDNTVSPSGVPFTGLKIINDALEINRQIGPWWFPWENESAIFKILADYDKDTFKLLEREYSVNPDIKKNLVDDLVKYTSDSNGFDDIKWLWA